MMKIISGALVCFTFVVAAMAQNILSSNGPLMKMLAPSLDPGCINDCDKYIKPKDCDPPCLNQPENFVTMINEVFKRFRKPLCNVTLDKLDVGQVDFPLKIENDPRSCYMTGNLEVIINKKDTDVTFTTNNRKGYYQNAKWTVEFRSFTVNCPRLPDAKIPESAIPLFITVDITFVQILWFTSSDIQSQINEKYTSFKYLLDTPKGISQPDLEAALKNTFEKAEVMRSLIYYLQTLTLRLWNNCVIDTCNSQCPNSAIFGP